MSSLCRHGNDILPWLDEIPICSWEIEILLLTGGSSALILVLSWLLKLGSCFSSTFLIRDAYDMRLLRNEAEQEVI